MPRRQQPHQAPGAKSTVALGQCFIDFAIVFEPLFGKLFNPLFSQLFKKQPLQFQPFVRRFLIRWLRGPPGRSRRPFGWRFAARRDRR